MKNAFGHEIPEITEILQDKGAADFIRETRRGIFAHLEIEPEKSEELIKELMTVARESKSEADYEREAHAILVRESIADKIPDKLSNRAEIAHTQVAPHLTERNVLDLGCGDGKVGELISKDGFDVTLADIYKHEHIKNVWQPFSLTQDGKPLPFEDDQFDNTLLYTVFHHANDPIQLLNEAYRVTKHDGRVLVVESVFGVHGENLAKEEREKIKNFLALTDDQQRKVNAFFDHEYNRVIHYSEDPAEKVNLPFNFNTPDAWKEIFEDNGLEQLQVIHHGIDLPIVPEYHTLHILRPEKWPARISVSPSSSSVQPSPM